MLVRRSKGSEMTRIRVSIGGTGRSSRPWTAEVDRDVQDPGSFGIVHPEEEDIGPGRVREVEPDRRALDQDREKAVVGGSLQQARVDPDRMLRDLTDPEHPAVPPGAPDRSADLVGERLVGDPLVDLGQGAEDRAVGTVVLERGSERCDGLLEPPLHQVGETFERDHPAGREVGRVLEPVAVDRVQEDRGADPLVEVPRVAAERLEVVASLEDVGGREAGEEILDRAVADARLGAGDGLDQRIHGGRDLGEGWVGDYEAGQPAPCSILTTDSRSVVSISWRSTPARAIAIWASTTPNLTPRL